MFRKTLMLMGLVALTAVTSSANVKFRWWSTADGQALDANGAALPSNTTVLVFVSGDNIINFDSAAGLHPSYGSGVGADTLVAKTYTIYAGRYSTPSMMCGAPEAGVGSYVGSYTYMVLVNTPYVAGTSIEGVLPGTWYGLSSISPTPLTQYDVLPPAPVQPVTDTSDGDAIIKTTRTVGNSINQHTLTVASSHGNPTPPVGISNYPWGASVTCSVESAVSQGGTNWVCVGWTGTGSVPSAGGTTNTGPILLTNLASSIAWQWEAESTIDFTYTTNNGTLTITKYTGPGGAVTIPDTIDGMPVTSIGTNVFNYCTNLTSISISTNIYSIGDGAFSYCTSLPGVTIPNSVASIGDGAFMCCFRLTNITIPDSVISIGNNAFLSCTNLTSITIPDSVTSIGCWAFSSTKLANVSIPKSVTNIGAYAFIDCTNLSAITVDPLNPVYGSVNGCLFDWIQATLLQCPAGKIGSYTIPDSVANIGDYAFLYCTGLAKVTIPNSITNIGDYAFGYCTVLTGVYFTGNAPSVGSYAFSGDDNTTVYHLSGTTDWPLVPDLWGDRPTALWELSVPFTYTTNNGTITITGYTGAGGDVSMPGMIEGLPVTRIGDFAFYLCTNLTEVMIPNSVTTFGEWTFGSCSRLDNVIIPASVTNIGIRPFIGCRSLSTIVVDIDNHIYSSAGGALFDKNQAKFILCPEGKAGSYTIPSGATKIGNQAFLHCSSLTNVVIPNTITRIDNWAFSDCRGLTSITIPASVISMGWNVFQYCSNLTDIVVDIGNSAYSSTNGVLFDKNGTTLIECPGGKVGNYTIPDSVNGIGTSAFYSCRNLTNVMICSSVTNIGGYTFSDCGNLMGVYFEGNAPNVGLDVFRRATNVTVYHLSGTMGWPPVPDLWNGRPTALWKLSVPYTYTTNNGTITITKYTGSGGAVTIPDTIEGLPVSCIGEGAFERCSTLTNLTISTNVSTIGDYAFTDCSSLTSITIPTSVSHVGYRAFSDCRSLTAIIVDDPNSFYTSMDGVLFNKSQTTLIQCPGGKSGIVTISGSVTNIGNCAFYICQNLTNVTIGSNVTSIGSYAFTSCSSLTNVTIPKSVTSIGNGAFHFCDSLTAIEVDASNSVYSSVERVLLNKTQTVLIQCPGGRDGSYTIPNSVTNIGDLAFSGCASLINVTIPDGVTGIGDYAFNGCGSLMGVYFRGSAPSLGSYAFSGANNATIYHLSGTAGWPPVPDLWAGRPTALWTDDYYLTLATLGAGTLDRASGLYAAGSNVIVTATASNHYHFTGWSGETNGCTLVGNQIIVPMTGPRAITASFAIDQHTLTVVSPHGGASPGTVTNNYNTVLAQAITNSPVTGVGTQYVCVGATALGNGFTQVTPTNVTLTLTNNATLTWQWTTNYYLTLGTSGSGAVTVASGWRGQGSNVTVSAVAVPHYHFVNWSGDTNGATIVGTNITVVMTGPKSIVASFAIDRHTLSIASPYGTADLPVGTYTNDYGTVLTNRVSSPDARGTTQYVCTGWAMAGNGPASGGSTSLVMTVTNNATLAWQWTTNYYLTLTTSGSGAVDRASGWCGRGSNVTITATASNHYHLASWIGDTNGCTLVGNQIIVPMTGPRAITASFAIDQHTLTVVSPYGGASPGTATTNYGTVLEQAITNSPVTGVGTQYVCVGATATGNGFTQVTPTNVTLTLTNTATLTWMWTTNYYLTLGTSGSGAVTVASGWRGQGSNVTVSAVAIPHYHFVNWSGDTNGATIVGTNITVVMTGPKSIVASFAIDRHTLSVASLYGTANPPVGAYTNDYGTVLTNRVNSPDTRGATQYVCTGWAMAGNGPASGGTTSLVMTLTNNATLTWLWLTNYWVEISTNGCGSVNTTSGWLTNGASVTLSATPMPGWSFMGWTGDAGSQLSNQVAAVVMIDRPYAITASFADITPPGALLEITPPTSHGQPVRIGVTPSEPLSTAPSMTLRDAGNSAVPVTSQGEESNSYWFVSDPSGAADGLVAVVVALADKSGNRNQLTGNFIVDKVSPSLAVTLAPLVGLGTQSLTVTSSEALGGWPSVALKDGAGTAIPITHLVGGSTTFRYAFLVEETTGVGTGTVSIAGVDQAGNTGTVNRTFLIDSEAPDFSLSTPNLAGVGTFSVTVMPVGVLSATPVVTVRDAAGTALAVEFFSLIGGKYRYKVTVPWNAADGAATVQVSVSDSAGNTRTMSGNTLIDVTPPVLTILVTPDPPGGSVAPLIEVQSSEALVAAPAVTATVDGVTPLPLNAPTQAGDGYRWQCVSNYLAVIEAQGADLAGNVTRAVKTYADLAVFNEQIGFSDVPGMGRPVIVTTVVTNTGLCRVENIPVTIACQTAASRTILAEQHVTLDKGAAVVLTADWPTASQTSNPSIWVTVDPTDVLKELVETNNVAVRGSVTMASHINHTTYLMDAAAEQAWAQVYETMTSRRIGSSDASVEAWLETQAGTRVGGPWAAGFDEPNSRFVMDFNPASLGLEPGSYVLVWRATGAGFAPVTSRNGFSLIRDFTVSLTADKASYQRGSKIPLSGAVLSVGSEALLGRTVELTVTSQYGLRHFSAITGTNGHFSLLYSPDTREAGAYQVVAVVKEGEIQRQSPTATFVIDGLYLSGPTGEIRMFAGSPCALTYKVRNIGTEAISGLQVALTNEVGGSDPAVSFETEDMATDLSAGHSTEFVLRLSATQTLGERTFSLVVRSAQGSEEVKRLTIRVLGRNPSVHFEPDHLESIVPLNSQFTRSVRIINSGWTGAQGVVLGSERPEWVQLMGLPPVINQLPGNKGLSDEGFGLFDKYGLIARIGTNEPAFLVGTGGVFSAGTSGTVQFRMNEADDQLADNHGQIAVGLRSAGVAQGGGCLVRANQGWQDSGFEVAAGRVVSVTVEGLWQSGTNESRDACGSGAMDFSIMWSPTNALLAAQGTPTDWTVRLSGSNVTEVVMPVRSWVVVPGNGAAQVRVTDAAGYPIADARVTVYAKNYDPVAGRFPMMAARSLTNGVVLFPGLMPGGYGYHVSTFDCEDALGALDVTASATSDVHVVVQPSLVSVSWEVNETRILDHYDVILRTTYNTEKAGAVLISDGIHRVMEAGELVTGKTWIRNFGRVAAVNLTVELPLLDGAPRLQFVNGGTRMRIGTLGPGETRWLDYQIDLSGYSNPGVHLRGATRVVYQLETEGLNDGGAQSASFDVDVATIDNSESLILDPWPIVVFRTHLIGPDNTPVDTVDLGGVRVKNPSSNSGTVIDMTDPKGAMYVKSYGLLDIVLNLTGWGWVKVIDFMESFSWIDGEFAPPHPRLAPGQSCFATLKKEAAQLLWAETDLASIGGGLIYFEADWINAVHDWTWHIDPILFCSLVDGLKFFDMEWHFPLLGGGQTSSEGGVGGGCSWIWPFITGGGGPSGPPSGYVTFDIHQEVTFDRQAFVAKLNVANSSQTRPLENMRVNIEVKNDQGEIVATDHRLCSDLFFCTPELTGIASVDGQDNVATNSSVKGKWTIIPTRQAGGHKYFMRANLSWNWGAVPGSLSTTWAEIQVDAQPFVRLDYFIQPEFKANEPFYLGVRASNVGGAPVHNLQILSHQPEIVSYSWSFPPSVQIIGTEGLHAAVGSGMTLNFETLDPGQCGMGKWVLKANPGGYVTDFRALSVKHDDDLGGEATSLLDVQTHISWVTQFGLVNNGSNATMGSCTLLDTDTNEVPDTLMDESDGQYHDVRCVSAVETHAATLNEKRMDISVEATDGWIYLDVRDPFGGSYAIKRICNGQGRVLDPRNYWARDGRIRWCDIGAETYSIEFEEQPRVVGHTGALALDKTRYTRLGSVAHIQLTDPDSDLHAGGTNDSVTVDVTSAGDMYGEQVVLLESVTPGLFEGELTFEATPNPNNGRICVADRQVFAVSYADAMGAQGTAVTVRAQAQWAANGAPFMAETNPEVTMDEDGSPQPFSLALHAQDPDGDSVRWWIGAQGLHGLASVVSSGLQAAVSYEPLADWNGVDVVFVGVDDGFGGTNTVEVRVVVMPRNDPPMMTVGPAVAGRYQVGEQLTCGEGTWNDDRDTSMGGTSTITHTYQWWRADDIAGGNACAISGATNDAILLTMAERFKCVRVVVTATDNGVGEPAWASCSAASAWQLVDFQTKLIRLSGPLDFGRVTAGQTSNLVMTIYNDGNTNLTVSRISCPSGFSGAGSGSIPAGGATNVVVTFAPSDGQHYRGTIMVSSDATSGSCSTACSGTGIGLPEMTFNETFSDGDFTADPIGILVNATVVPGLADAIDRELHVQRTGAGGLGGAISVHYPVSIPLNDTTTIAFDVKVISSSVRYGTGDGNEEYPATLELVLQDVTNGTRMLRFAYNDDGGASKTNAGMLQIARGDAPAGVWIRGERFIIQQLMTQKAIRITEVRLGGSGWDFESYFDNVMVFQDPEADFDLDGAADWVEEVAGTDPHDEHSVFKIRDCLKGSYETGKTILWWDTVSGRVYSVWSSTDLISPWSNLLERVGDGSFISYTNDLPTPRNRFFRVDVRSQQ